jgi:hypothetical protein
MSGIANPLCQCHSHTLSPVSVSQNQHITFGCQCLLYVESYHTAYS